jgi:carboxylesterase 2
LKWIHENIAAFGGDGLFVGAIVQSGVRDPHDPLCSSLAENYITLDTALENGIRFFASNNATTLEEMRALPLADLTAASGPNSVSFTAVLDYYAMPDTYYNTLVKGLVADVPVMTGNTKDESGATYGLNISLATYISDLNTTYGAEWAPKFLAEYPANDSTTASAAYNAQWTDRSKVGTWTWSGLWATAKTSPVYNYYWDHAPPGQTQGAHHESEINYVMNNLYDTDLPWTAEDYAIAKKMVTYWVNFIKTGNPNGNNLTQWDPVVNSSAVVQRVGDGWEALPIASIEAQIQVVKDWFATLTAYRILMEL